MGINELTHEQRGYVAGMLDGEGTIVLRSGIRVSFSLRICQKSPEVLHYIARIIGAGRVNKRYTHINSLSKNE